MSDEPITNQKHNDFIGTDDNLRRVPGAEKATSGHQFEAVFPKDESGATLGRAGHWGEAKGAAAESNNKAAQIDDSNVSTDDMVRHHISETNAAAAALHQSNKAA